MTRRSHQGAAHEQRDNEAGTHGANLEFGHCTPPEGWLVAAANHYAARPVVGSRHLAEHVSQEHQGILLSHSYLFGGPAWMSREMSLAADRIELKT